MAKSTNYYNVDDFNNYKRTQGKCIPPRTNVIAAASHIQTLFDTKKFTYGFMGGLPMLCLGYKREMPDLHIAYDERDFERLQVKLGSDRRYSSCTNVYLHTLIVQRSSTNRHEPTVTIQNTCVDWS